MFLRCLVPSLIYISREPDFFRTESTAPDMAESGIIGPSTTEL